MTKMEKELLKFRRIIEEEWLNCEPMKSVYRTIQPNKQDRQHLRIEEQRSTLHATLLDPSLVRNKARP